MVNLRTWWKDSPHLYIPIEPQKSTVGGGVPTGNWGHLIKGRVRNIRLLTDTRMECICFNSCRVGEDPRMCCAVLSVYSPVHPDNDKCLPRWTAFMWGYLKLPWKWRCVVESAGFEVGIMTMLGHKEVENKNDCRGFNSLSYTVHLR